MVDGVKIVVLSRIDRVMYPEARFNRVAVRRAN